MRMGMGLVSQGMRPPLHLTDPASRHTIAETDVLTPEQKQAILAKLAQAIVAQTSGHDPSTLKPVGFTLAPAPITHADTGTGQSTPPLTQTVPPTNASTVAAVTQPKFPTPPAPGFMDGVTAWEAPTQAFIALFNMNDPTLAIPTAEKLGLVAVPLALAVGIYYLMTKGKR